MNKELTRDRPNIKLSKASDQTDCWTIEVDNGDYDATLVTSASDREQALLFALAIAGISVEIQSPGYFFHNQSTLILEPKMET